MDQGNAGKCREYGNQQAADHVPYDAESRGERLVGGEHRDDALECVDESHKGGECQYAKYDG